MKPVKNLILTAVLAATTCGVAHAKLDSHGTATGTITVTDAPEWSITLKQNGVAIRDDSGALTNDGNHLLFTVKNGTLVEGAAYLRGAGPSLKSDGTILAVNNHDSTKTFEVLPDTTGWAFDSVEAAYKSKHNVDVGKEKEADITPWGDTKVEPGVYTVNLELFTKAA